MAQQQKMLDAHDLDALLREADGLRTKATSLSEDSRVGEMFRQLAMEMDGLRTRAVQADSVSL